VKKGSSPRKINRYGDEGGESTRAVEKARKERDFRTIESGVCFFFFFEFYNGLLSTTG